MIKKKYELTDATIEVNGRTLHRIRALRDFGNVEKGDLGGFIEHEGNLSHEGDCWVGDNAWVYEGARVYDDAQISDNAALAMMQVLMGMLIILTSSQLENKPDEKIRTTSLIVSL
ncbi:hypothetical protein [Bartonella sp. CL100XZDX]|uniref:hypothetical protein n=1 Tax=Bartonella sp. CL100XZDX TaxID=3243515 RepID=UPI0035CEBB68